jgi:hypothetical protein
MKSDFKRPLLAADVEDDPASLLPFSEARADSGAPQPARKVSSSDEDADNGRRVLSDGTSKWVALALYSYVTALQSLLWITFSSVPDFSRTYLSVNDATLNLWLDYGPIAFLVSVWYASHLLSASRFGLQSSIRVAACLCCVAATLRCLPLLFSSDDLNGSDNSLVIGVIHVCQFLNGAAAPFVVASPAYLSMLWFPDAQRNTATAIANVANAVGRAVGFFLGPALVHSASDMPTLLLLEVGLAILPVVAAFTCLAPFPVVPPSRAAAEESACWEQREQERADRELAIELRKEEEVEAGLVLDSVLDPVAATARSSVWEQVSIALKTPSFLLLCAAGGLQMAFYGAWSGELPSVLTANGLYTDVQAGAFGSVNTFAGIIGGVAIGWATDAPVLRSQLIPVIIVLALASTACFGLFAGALAPDAPSSLAGLAGSYPLLLTLVAAAGFLRGGTDPLFFEATAEAVAERGVPEGTAGAVLTFFYHAVLCLILSVPPAALQAAALPGMAVCLFAAAVLLAPVNLAYTRR